MGNCYDENILESNPNIFQDNKLKKIYLNVIVLQVTGNENIIL